MIDRDVCVFGLGFGDEGKGATVDWLCRTTDVDEVVRFNGGPQAGHNVVQPDGKHHTFSQFGSGTFHRVPTFLSRFVFVDPVRAAFEAQHLQELGIGNPWRLLRVDPHCPLVVPDDAVRGLALEAGRATPHGSCGVGFGAAVERVLKNPLAAPRVGDIGTRALEEKLDPLCEDDDDYQGLLVAFELFAGLVTIDDAPPAGQLVFEGAQGVLLDEWHGFHPHTTWSTCTPENAMTLADEWGRDTPFKLGVTRTYQTRHGAGPFPTEVARWRTSQINAFDEPHNTDDGPQGPFRKGRLDLVLLDYAVRASGGVDALALTHVDKLPLSVVDDYRVLDRTIFQARQMLQPNPEHDLETQSMLTDWLFKQQPGGMRLLNFGLELLPDVPTMVVSNGPTWEDRTLLTSRRNAW